MSEGEQVAQVRDRPRPPNPLSRLAAHVRALVLRHPQAWFFGALLILYLATATYVQSHIDVAAAMRPAWAVARFGTLDLEGLPHQNLPWYFPFDDGIYSDRFPGAIFYLVPAYWMADRLGFHDFTFVPGTATAAIVAAGAVFVLHRAYARILPTTRAVWVASAFTGLGTGAWSLAAHAPWSHTLNLLLIAVALSALSRGTWTTAGLWLGLAVTTRPTMAVAALAVGAALALAYRSLVPLVKVGLGCVPGVALLFIYNGVLFGRWGPSNGHELGGDVQLRLVDLPFNVLGALLSPSRGVLIYYPILVLVLNGVSAGWRAATAWERAAVVGGLAVFVTQLSLNRYSGGDTFFGPRLMIEPLALAAPFMARAVWQFAQRHGSRFVRWAVVAGIVIHGVGGLTVHVIHGF